MILSVPTLETARLRLRRYEEADLSAYVALRSDPNVYRFTTLRPMTVEESWQRIVAHVGLWVLRGFGGWAIEEKETGIFIGEIGFNDARRDGLSSMHGLPEAGWFLAADRHRQGYGTEAVRAIHEWADVHFTADRTVCAVRPDNLASIRLAERVGYSLQEERTYRDLPVYVFERRRPAR